MMLDSSRAPKPGEIMRMPELAQTFRLLGEKGKEGFYEGPVAESIIEVIKNLGGVMSLDDLKGHTGNLVEPIKVNYKGVDIWEIPPNGQGIVALMALKILEGFDMAALKHNSPEYLHLVIESLRLAFVDANAYVADPEHHPAPIDDLLSDDYAALRRKLVDLNKAQVDVKSGSPKATSDTVYFCAVDAEGNGCSYINSNYMGFGSGVIPKGCGFTLQNRGANFSLSKGDPNELIGGRRYCRAQRKP